MKDKLNPLNQLFDAKTDAEVQEAFKNITTEDFEVVLKQVSETLLANTGCK